MKEYVGNMREIWRRASRHSKRDASWRSSNPSSLKASIKCGKYELNMKEYVGNMREIWRRASWRSSNSFLVGLYKDLDELRALIQRHETSSLFFSLTKKSLGVTVFRFAKAWWNQASTIPVKRWWCTTAVYLHPEIKGYKDHKAKEMNTRKTRNGYCFNMGRREDD